MTATDTQTIRVSITLDTEEVRRDAERFLTAGKHGTAHLLYKALEALESGTPEVKRALGLPCEDEGDPQDASDAHRGDSGARLFVVDAEESIWWGDPDGNASWPLAWHYRAGRDEGWDALVELVRAAEQGRVVGEGQVVVERTLLQRAYHRLDQAAADCRADGMPRTAESHRQAADAVWAALEGGEGR
ncbi:MAG: hypothetical protein Q4F65_12960 [Propionibacteriaceae bacterium]|nr:hypothetical protein [Propionibacteriaceae bacterium]